MQASFSTNECEAQALANSKEPHKEGELTVAQVGALRELVPYAGSWVNWGPRALNEAGEPKTPITPKTGRWAKINDPKTWGSFEEAVAQVKPRGHGDGGGVGLIVTDAAPNLVGVDVDDCRDPTCGSLTPFGAEVVKRFDGTYIELSPSGRGLRAFCFGSAREMKQSAGGGSLEIYPAGAARFLRVTGAVVDGTAGKVTACQAGLDWLVAQVGGAAPANEPPASGGDGAATVETSASNGPNSGSSQGSDKADGLTLEAIKAQVFSMDIGSVETELAEAWNPDPDAEVGLSAARVVVKLDNIPTGRQGLGEAIKRLKTGRENSNDDHAICCAAVRRGALVVNEVAGALVRLAGDGAREKLKRQDYQTRTAENALRAVLGEVRAHRRGVKAIERAGRAFLGWHFVKDQTDNKDGKDGGSAWALPQALVEALAASGDVLALDKAGKPISSDANAVVILRNDPEMCALLGFDELQQRAVRTGGVGAWAAIDRDAAKQPGPIADDDAVRVSLWLQRTHGMRLRHGDLMRAIEAAARSKPFNPLTQRLDDLAAQWDGAERVRDWLTRWAMADDEGREAYVSAAGRCFLVSAVARAFRPGCKVDTVLTLEGAPGGGKSSLFNVLADATIPEMFTDGIHDASATASIVEGAGGRWILELAELAAVRKAADVEALKASLSRTVDTYRRPYDSKPMDYPRRFVFVATTNKSQYLNDPTGALLRRFMPVPVKSSERVKFDLEGLAREAGQLWGEAVHLFRKGAKWWIDAGDGEAYDQWEATRKARKEDEVFHDQVLALLLEAAERKDYAKRYSLVSIAAEVGFEKAAAGDRVAQAQLADTLRGLGLEKRRAARGAYWALTPEGVALLDRVLRDASQEERAEALRNHCH